MIDLQSRLAEAQGRFAPLLPPGTNVYGVLAAVDFDSIDCARSPLFAMLPEHYSIKSCALAITSAGLVMVASRYVSRVEHWAVEGVPWASIEDIFEPQAMFTGDRAPMNVKLKSSGTIRFVAWPKLESPGSERYLQLAKQQWMSANGLASPPPPSLIAHLGGGQLALPVRESPPMDPAVKAKWIRRAMIGGGALTSIAIVGGLAVAITNAQHNAEQRAAADTRRERDQRRHAEIEADTARYPSHGPLAPTTTPAGVPSLARMPEASAVTASLTDAGFEVRDRGGVPGTAIRWRIEAEGRCGQRISLTATDPPPSSYRPPYQTCAAGAGGTVCAEVFVTPRNCVFDPTVRDDDPSIIARRRTSREDWARWTLHRIVGS